MIIRLLPLTVGPIRWLCGHYPLQRYYGATGVLVLLATR